MMPSSIAVSTTLILVMPSSAICLTTAFDSGSNARATTRPFSLVHGIMNQNTRRQVFELLGILDRKFFDLVKQLEDFLVAATGLFAVVFALGIDAAFDIQNESARKSVVVKNLRRRFLRSK